MALFFIIKTFKYYLIRNDINFYKNTELVSSRDNKLSFDNLRQLLRTTSTVQQLLIVGTYECTFCADPCVDMSQLSEIDTVTNTCPIYTYISRKPRSIRLNLKPSEK